MNSNYSIEKPMHILVVLMLLFAGLFTLGCVNSIFPNVSTNTTIIGAPINNLTGGINSFALSFYNKLSDNNDNNIFYSPFSIYSALSILYEGTNGTSRNEMTKYNYMISNDTLRKDSFQTIDYALDHDSGDAILTLANALWIDKDFRVLDSYKYRAKTNYGSEVNNLKFDNQQESLNQINSWVNNKTNGKIPTIINEIPSFTKLIITNAIYFRGKWAIAFDKGSTQNEIFYSPDGNLNVSFMEQWSFDENNYLYYEDEDVQILELPYKDSILAMDIFLPKGNYTHNYTHKYAYNYSSNDSIKLIRNFEGELNKNRFNYYMSNLSEHHVEVIKIPKFKFMETYDCINLLKSMGVKSIFNPDSSDLSNIDGKRDLVVSKVIHKAYIDVNEEGTEAAAATAVIVGKSLAPKPISEPVHFVANHPFIFIIRDTNTNTILFMGRIIRPVYNK